MPRNDGPRWIAAFALGVCGVAAQAQPCPDNVPHVTGTWRTLPYQMPINPISATLLRTGEVLIVAGSENDANNHGSGAAAYRNAIWDPTGVDETSIVVREISYDVFCSGTAQLPHGRTLIVGGSSDYSFTGERRSSIFDPATGQFAQSQSMTDGRWYATATTLGDGRIMAFSGLGSTGATNMTVEIYDPANPGAGWGTPITEPFTPPLFPRAFLLPNGKVFYTGQGSGSRNATGWFFDPVAKSWTLTATTTRNRTYGGCVLFPLLPPSYTPKVMCLGGGSPATNTTETIDLSAATPSWTPGASMSTGRIELNTVLLPDGRVLAAGGSLNNEEPDTAGRTADLYDSVSGGRGSGGTASYSRLYHSTALLLPDATVAVMGSNPADRGKYLGAIEIYTPPYLYDAADKAITTNRPAITDVTPSVVGYGTGFSVTYTGAASIGSAVLVRPGSTTHAFDMEQRVVGLCGPSPQPACSGSGTLGLTAPANGNIAPPGYYMLFLLDPSGVPSVARFVELSPYGAAPPDGTISTPSTDVTINAGGSVAFDTSTTASKHSWVFPGGSPASSSAQHPGLVTYAAAGQYVASLTVLDGSNNSDPSPPTRTITVLPATADFEIDVTPQARALSPGQSTTFDVTVVPRTGFTGNVALSVSTEGSFPTGVTSGGFSPSSIAGSGTSTLTMNTTTTAAPRALSLTVKGTSGPPSSIVHASATTLLVNLAPPGGVAANRTDTQADLSWQASAGATSYLVGRALASGGPYETVACTTSLGFTDTGLEVGTTYYYVVTAFFAGGPDAGGASAESVEVVAGGPCDVPTYGGWIAATQSPTQVTWSWTAGGAAAFDVLQGSLDTLRATGGDFTAALTAMSDLEATCIGDDVNGTSLVDPYGAPAVGCEFVVLRPESTSCSAHGTYDESLANQPTSRDPGITASPRDCP